MIKILSFFGLLLFLPVVVQAQGPKLEIPAAIYDFGEISEGELITHSFIIKNVGTESLKISRVQAACGCTAVQPAQPEIQPGESTNILATFNTKGFNGYNEKRIQVYTNDSSAPFSTLEFRGKIKPEVAVNPPRVYFGQVRKGAEGKKTLEILVEKASGIQIRDIAARSPEVNLQVADYNKGSQVGKKVTLQLNKDLPVGVYKTRISVSTTSTKTPVINIPVFARIVGDLALEPSDASFGLLEGPLTEPVSRVLKLENTASFPVRIIDIQSSIPEIKPSVETVNDGKNYSIIVTANEGVEGTIRGKVTVKTDHPDDSQRELSFSVFGIVTKKGL